MVTDTGNGYVSTNADGYPGTSAQVIADSIGPHDDRLTTFLVTFPRIILAEVNTHRMLSRNSASSRAVPVEKRIRQVEENPFVPMVFGANQPGMQSGSDIQDQEAARMTWLAASREAVHAAKGLCTLGVHKQLANRLLEPFLWHTAIISGTHWSNFFALRTHRDAQPEFRELALIMQKAMLRSTPKPLRVGEWHRPMCSDIELLRASYGEADINMISAGRAARVSYLTHDGFRSPENDLALAGKLRASGHMSPFEHVATPTVQSQVGNFAGWLQLRKTFFGEHDFGLACQFQEAHEKEAKR